MHERAKVVRAERAGLEGLSLRALARAFASRAGYERAQRLARRLQRPVVRDGWVRLFPPGPLAGWGRSRDLPAVPDETFREWWERACRGREAVLAPRPGGAGDAPGPVEVPRAYRDARRGWRGGPGVAASSSGCATTARRSSSRGDPRDAAAELLRARACGTRSSSRPTCRRPFGPSGVELVEDDGLGAAELDALDGALTTCAAACADTGTIALDGGAGQGRRAISLVPDLHVCVVRADQVVETVPELIARLEPSAREGRPIVLVSGPSATSDIGLERVEGVHGPRRLVVIVTA